QPGPFQRADGSTVTAQIMSKHEHIALMGVGNTEAAGLLGTIPFANRDLSLIVIVPYDGEGLHQLEGLYAALLPGWLDSPRVPDDGVEPAVILLPRFQIASDYHLNEALQAAGIIDAFGTAADFSGIDGGQGSLELQQVVHQA